MTVYNSWSCYKKEKKILQATPVIFWYFFMFHQILLSLQVKRTVNINDKYDIYKLPHELKNDLRFRILKIRKYKENLKTP